MSLSLAFSAWCAGPQLTPDQIQDAIKDGRRYKTAEKVLACLDPEYASSPTSQWEHRCDRAPTGRRIRLESALAADSISKYATFFNDFVAVVAQSAAANQQMRDLKPSEVESKGFLHVLVEVHVRGAWGAAKLEKSYGDGRAHLVLEIAERIVQPVEKDMKSREGQSLAASIWGFKSGQIVLDFAFDVSPEDLKRPVEVILIDGDEKRHKHEADLAVI
jgi:nitrogen fixation-related uncharacterized protein